MNLTPWKKQSKSLDLSPQSHLQQQRNRMFDRCFAGSPMFDLTLPKTASEKRKAIEVHAE